MKSHYAYVPLSKGCKDDLKAVQAALASDAKELKLRPAGIDGAHFTLGVYMTDKSRSDATDEELTQSINKVLKEFLDKWPPMDLTFGGLGSFGSRFVFINLTNEKELETLRQDMNTLLEKEGIYLADQRFTPHVTLYRAGHKSGGSPSSFTVKEMVKRTDLPPVTSSPVSEILFKKLRG